MHAKRATNIVFMIYGYIQAEVLGENGGNREFLGGVTIKLLLDGTIILLWW